MSTTYLAVTNDTERQLANVEAVTGATTLTAEDSGKVFILKASAGAQITLPAVATSAGLRFKFVVGLAFATTDWTVKSATNVIEGSVLVNGAHVAGVDENTISFVASAESIGDFAELVCDGTNWYVNGSGVTAGSITLTAV
jgi:hypothetical protein